MLPPMLAPLGNIAYRRLFAAQLIALLGTGLATIALALLAYELAGAAAGAVLGTALAIKMIAYVTVAPMAGALAAYLPRRGVLISLDLVRAAVILLLPFVDQIWQIYVLIFVLQAASASFTPTFQAVIPQVLDDERTYTEALSLSRLAYDLENLISPMLAGLLLMFVTFHVLFVGTAAGFVVSALIISFVVFPRQQPAAADGFADRLTRGLKIYLRTPRLRGLGLLNFVVAAVGAVVLVNSVIYVRERLGHGETELALTMAAFGLGSMLMALALPRLLDHFPERRVMLAGAFLGTLGLLVSPVLTTTWPGLLILWLLVGTGYGAILTPAGRLLRRSATDADLPAVFAAQFSLSHACWLLTYPLAGWAGSVLGLDAAALVLTGVALVASVAALRFWSGVDALELLHTHTDLAASDPHIADAKAAATGYRHCHTFVIDDYHAHWPDANEEVRRLREKR